MKMTKKKGRQADPGSPGGDDSSESGEDNTQAGGKPCPHTAKGVDINGIRKNILKAHIKQTCADCSKPSSKVITPINKEKNEEVSEAKEESEQVKSDEQPLTAVEDEVSGMWLCLRCGYQGCGPPSNKNSHIAKHFAAPRSDCHALVTNTEQWNVWCQECDCEVAANSTKKLHECIEFLKRQPNACTSFTVILKSNRSTRNIDNNEQRQKTTVSEEDNTVEIAQEASVERDTPKRPGSKTVTLVTLPLSVSTNLHPRVKGLSNLGNTCFFNAVLQCLAQTPFLVPLLKETAEDGEQFFLPGCPEGGKDQEPVPPLEGTLGPWGQLTEALADTLAEMQDPGGSAVVTPRRLLSLISQRAPHLGQGDQQDSQELLRHLMEGVRTEELRRFQDRILVAVGLSRKTDPATVDDSTKAKAKVYNHQASQLLLRPDQLFQGRLISTLQCQDCLRQSHTPECFLDLSLPIASDRPQPPLVHRSIRRESKESDVEPKEKDAPSKHQLKKERRLAHKNRKKRGSRQNSEEPSEINESQGTGNNSEESKQSDADVEDNEEQDKQEEPLDLSNKPLDLSLKNTFKQSFAICEDPKPVSGPIMVDPMGVAHCAMDVGVKVVIEDRGGGESGYATNGGTQSNSPGSPTSAAEEADPNCSHATALCSELASLALGDGDSVEKQDETVELPETVKTEPEQTVEMTAVVEQSVEEEGACALEPEPEEEEENSQMWNQTLAPRPPPCEPEGDCSIQSCLNQFAAIELLTGNNRVSCKTCTQRAGKSAQSKTVCTNSTKQLLVSAPPAILTLHLKRFEVYGSRFRKVSRPVSFPLLLDIAPICSTKCRDLPSVGSDQTSLIYSLYGVVEHSGGLAGGHYVAYVKARAQPDKDDPRYKFLLSNNWEAKRRLSQHHEEQVEGVGAEGGQPEPPPGKWYYISDSRVSEVSEKKVLQTQAYLLFYERIL